MEGEITMISFFEQELNNLLKNQPQSAGIFGSYHKRETSLFSDYDIFVFYGERQSNNADGYCRTLQNTSIGKVSFNTYVSSVTVNRNGHIHLCIFDNTEAFNQFMNYDGKSFTPIKLQINKCQ